MEITDKSSMYQLLRAGKLGNHVQSWTSIDEWRASGYKGEVGIRDTVPGGTFIPYVAPADVPAKAFPGCILNAMQRDEHIILQGEVTEQPELYLQCSRVRLPMRQALRTSEHHYGAVARLMLRSCMDPDSYEELMWLLDEYPQHSIEFSVYNVCVGIVPHRNTIIWEVRKY